MLLTVMLLTIYSFDKIWPIIILLDIGSLPYLVDSNKLLIKLTSSVVNTTERLNDCNIDIVVILNILADRMQKIVVEDPTGVGSIPKVTMNKYYREVITPMRLRSMSVFTIHQLIILMTIHFQCHFMNEISHQNDHHYISILLKHLCVILVR